jgi:RHS repeat-associated protein
LNLPERIEWTGNRGITFVYDATGQKLAKTVTSRNWTYKQEYFGGIEYKDGSAQHIAHSEGSVVKAASGVWQYEYVLRDHLGNTRVTFQDGESKGLPYLDWNTWEMVDPNVGNVGYNDGIVTAADIKQINHFYPFGLNMEGNWNGAAGNNKYQYNEKEWNDDFGLGWNDYGARFYNSAIGRWNNLDPLSELTEQCSPYSYVRNNPMNRIDPDGRWDIIVHAYSDRAVYGYGIAVVKDRRGNEIFRFNVRLEGVGGRNRMNDNSDTPLGIYDIPNKKSDMWMTGGSRAAYGPNPRLVLNGKSGEIKDSGRELIRIHGGRQEVFKNGRWIPNPNPCLNPTQGCLRAYDADMVSFKEIIDGIMAEDPEEYGGELNIVDDLQFVPAPYKNGMQYMIPVEAPSWKDSPQADPLPMWLEQFIKSGQRSYRASDNDSATDVTQA